MTNYVRRLIFIDANEKMRINPLFYPFLLASFIYGLGFLFGGITGWTGVTSSSLYTALYGFHSWLPQIWGVGSTLAGGSALTLMLRRKGAYGEAAAMFGVIVWLFAAITYAMGGYWLVLVTVTGPNLYFWVFYYLRLKWYEREKKYGNLVDAG